jgi:hypothetical protein
MTRSGAELPDLTLDQVRQRMRANGVRQILVKELAPNDNSKNQLYLGGSLSAANILPLSGEVRSEVTSSGNESMKALVPLEWLQPTGSSRPALGAQLILYPQYPEVRLSGFLKGVPNAPSELMNSRQPGRLLFLGVTSDRRVLAWACGPDSSLATDYRSLVDLEQLGVFRVVPIEALERRSTRERLLAELRRVHSLGWIASKSLSSDGTISSCDAQQCVGYTLEAELGVARNGRSEPDFLGWEVKATEVKSLRNLPSSKAITLMTPEPTGGVYRQEGITNFIRRYGYPDRRGVVDRLNFGGVHRVNDRHPLTGLTLRLQGYDSGTKKISSASGSLALMDDRDHVAAEWSFSHLLSIWNRKHAQAVYVPALAQVTPARRYHYGPVVRVAEGTDFTLLIRALSIGAVFLDPGIKLENASSRNPTLKRRSQFRAKYCHLGSLYSAFVEQRVDDGLG